MENQLYEASDIEKLDRYRRRLSEQEPLKESYHDHKENIMIATLGFLLVVNLFLFDHTKEILERGGFIFVISLIGYASIYFLGMRVLNRQYIMKRGAAAHAAAINADLWAIANGTFDPRTIGLSPERTREINLARGISDSRYVSEYWSVSYYQTYVDAYHKNIFKEFDFRTLIFAGVIGGLNALFFIYEAYRVGIFSGVFDYMVAWVFG